MTFENVDMLWLIWAVPALFLVYLWGIRKRRGILSRYASKKALSAIIPHGNPNGRRFKMVLMLAAVLFVSVALSGPQYGYHWQEIERRGIDIIIALDCSRSMLATDIPPTRLDRAKREVVDLLNMLQGDRVGLVAFSGTAFLQCPLTIDYEAFHLFLATLTPDFLPVGGTDLDAALTTALAGFKQEDASEKAIILITDGENTGRDAVSAARKVASAGVKLYCVGVGAADGVPIPSPEGGFTKNRDGAIVLSRLDDVTLKKMAVLTGGTYVQSVAGDMDLDAIYFQQIREKMEATSIAHHKKKVLENRYQWFLGLGVLMLIIECIIPIQKRAVIGLLVPAFLIMAPPAHGADLGEKIDQATSAYESGEYDQAAQSFIEAQLEAPDRPEIYYNLGNAQYKSGDLESAQTSFHEALGSQAPSLRQQAHYNLGNTQFKLGDLNTAIQSYEAALEIDPEDVQARENLEFVKKMAEQQQSGENQQKSPGEDGDSPENQKPSPSEGDKPDPNKPSDADNSGQSEPDRSEPSSQPPQANEGNKDEQPEQPPSAPQQTGAEQPE
ncbi:MAG: VWA domain-containing protein, partial [Deltaproteobacteria bacterium]|nr:VWA domain-containing protein [Deltaproteobacteria bacterium]